MVHAGDAPIDRYVVLEHLSEGGMGAIYVGKKMGAGGFEMEVVLKQLLPEFTQQEEFIDLFLREAKLSATLDHANIVHTIDLVTAGNEYFIVMEYLPGGDLRTLLKKAKRRGKRFSPAAAIYISREVLSALAYAHAKRDFQGKPLKLIHRDVSPSNILLSYAGEVKLTDFGIAKAATHTSLFYKVKGKIGYMSPEQAKSEPLDHRSDLYSLAVCMYEILTGERLFVHAGLTTSAEEIYSQPVPQVSKKVPGLTPDLDAIMQKALAIDPNARYQTAGELQEALMRCAHRNGLLMSAPELAKELRDACGPNDQWREDADDEDFGYVARAGTEIYDAVDDEDDEDDDDELDLGPMSVHSIAAKVAKPPKPPRPLTPSRPKLPLPRPKTEGASSRMEIDRFNGVELTSIINMMDVENEGSRPLVDLDHAPAPRQLDSGPRQLGSDPALIGPNLPLPPSAPLSASPPLPPPSKTGRLPGPPLVPPPSVRSDAAFEAMSTAPRKPIPPSGRMPAAPPQQVAAPQLPTERPRLETAPKTGLRIPPWIVIGVILLAAAIAGVIVALSGPSVGK
ncbi:MAG: serine/threonine protein kinase [Deltaproteobacteria bacterium]|nr:serine/threonine protein kinase [Deltaproteobacteria bacterium]